MLRSVSIAPHLEASEIDGHFYDEIGYFLQMKFTAVFFFCLQYFDKLQIGATAVGHHHTALARFQHGMRCSDGALTGSANCVTAGTALLDGPQPRPPPELAVAPGGQLHRLAG